MSTTPGTSTNPFEILGLDRSASFDDVKVAYRRLARQYHPDANPGDPDALERFTVLRRAYDRLKIFYQTLDQVDAAPGGSGPFPAPTGATSESLAERVLARAAAAAAQSTGDILAPSSTGAIGSGPSGELAGGVPVRRAFRRTGSLRQSEVVAMEVTAPAQVGERLPAPQQIESGNLAARAELIYGQRAIAASAAPQMCYAMIGLRASDGVVFPRIPVNLCLVLDHSSSMLRGGKVERLKETVRGIIEQLDEDDFLSIVTFGDRAEVLLPAQPLRNKAQVQGAIDAIRCRGGTEISRGLATGLSELSRNASRALSHLILLTDGQTYGDEMICLERSAEAAGMNVGITAYGLGADWNSTLLDGIAVPTGGHSDYIARPEAMAEAFSARVLALQSTTLRGVKVSVQPATGCTVQRATILSPMLRPLDLSADRAGRGGLLGDMSGNAEYRLLVEFVLGATQPGAVPVADLTLVYDVPGLQREAETLAIPLSVSATAGATPAVDPRVAEALRLTTVHRLQQQAWTEIDNGDAPKGTSLLRRAAEHLDAAGHGDLAAVAVSEAARVEGGDGASDENVKRIIYGTRKLG